MKLFLTLLLVCLIAIVNSQSNGPDFCNEESCALHTDCQGQNEVCCDAKCVHVGAIGTGDGVEGDSCICTGCSNGFNCNELGVCEADFVASRIDDCGCSEDSQCFFFGSCVDGTCKRVKNPGDSCVINEQCPEGYGCYNQVCTAQGTAVGETCYRRGERCGDDTICDFNPEYLGNCYEIYAALGESCYGRTCYPGNYCNDDYTCVAQKSGGETCDPNNSDECLSNCNNEDGICMQRKELDEPCESDEACISGMCYNDGTFNFCSERRTPGETCREDSHCTSGRCLYGICEEFQGIGDNCNLANGDPYCDDTSYCDTVTSSCRILKTDGDTCSVSAECDTGFCAGTCTTIKAVGEACTSSLECESFNCDVGGTDVCLLSSCGDALCTVNETCYRNADCAAGLSCAWDNKCHETVADGSTCNQYSGIPLPCGEGSFCKLQYTCDDVTEEGCTSSSIPCPANTKCNITSDVCDPISSFLASGEPCSSTYECQGYCNGTVCLDRLDEGAECNVFRPGQCDGTMQCSIQLQCKLISEEFAVVGEGCNLTRTCYESYCDDTTSLCTVPALGSLASGEILSEYGVTSRKYCQSGIAQNHEGEMICISTRDRAIGQSCVSDLSCGETAHCEYDDATSEYQCTSRNPPLKGRGETCQDDSECSGLCDGITEKCGPVPEAGDGCHDFFSPTDNDLVCLCEDNEYVYEELETSEFESIELLLDYYLDCKDTSLELDATYEVFYIPQYIGFDTANSEADATCHASAMKVMCGVLCPPLLRVPNADYYSGLYGTLFGAEDEVLINCDTGAVTHTDGCPKILLEECSALGPQYAKLEEIREEFGFPSIDGRIPVTASAARNFMIVFIAIIFLMF